jgi:hypothetical protein
MSGSEPSRSLKPYVTELVQQLSHNYVAYYDNISQIKPWISDVLCRGVTGSGFSKRQLVDVFCINTYSIITQTVGCFDLGFIHSKDDQHKK